MLDPGLEGPVLEGAVPPITVEPVGDSGVGLGRAVAGDSGGQSADPVLLVSKVQVTADKEVEPAVAVEIDERGARIPPRIVDTGRLDDLLEGAVAPVPPQLVGAEVGEENIDPAVVVVVRHRDADTITVGSDSGRLGHIGEGKNSGAIWRDHQVVAVQTIAEGVALLRR